MAAIINLTSANFDEVINSSDIPVVVDFWADWCGPCKMIAPILNEIADEKGDAVQVAKLDVTAEPDLAKRFQVQGIPTMIVFRDGEVDVRSVGAKGKVQMVADLGI